MPATRPLHPEQQAGRLVAERDDPPSWDVLRQNVRQKGEIALPGPELVSRFTTRASNDEPWPFRWAVDSLVQRLGLSLEPKYHGTSEVCEDKLRRCGPLES